MVKTTFHYSEKEISDFFRFHLMTKENTKWIYYGSSLAFVVIGSLFTFVFQIVLLGLLLISVAILLILLFPIQVNRTIKKQVQSRFKRPPQQINFSDDGIDQIIEDKKLSYRWDQVLEVNETKQYFYLYVSKVSALIVTKEILLGDAKDELIALIKKHQLKIIYYQNK